MDYLKLYGFKKNIYIKTYYKLFFILLLSFLAIFFLFKNKSIIKKKIHNILDSVATYSKIYKRLEESNKNLKIDLYQTSLDTINIIRVKILI